MGLEQQVSHVLIIFVAQFYREMLLPAAYLQEVGARLTCIFLQYYEDLNQGGDISI